MYNVLFLCNRTRHYNEKLGRMRFDAMEALSHQFDISLAIWGRNWAHYDNNKSFPDNYKSFFGSIKHDLIIVFYGFDYPDIKKVDIPKCIIYFDMSQCGRKNKIKEIKEEIIHTDAYLLFCTYPKEMSLFKEIFEKQKITTWKSKGPKFIKFPHHANQQLCRKYTKPFNDREYDISLTGCTDWIYPLRNRMRTIFPKLEKLGYKTKILEHPGYNVKDAHLYTAMKPYLELIGNSKISVTCCSHFKYKVCKYIEIPMCGAAIAADIPTDELETADYTIVLDNSMTDSEIIHKLDFYLKNTNARKKMVEKGHQYTNNFSFDHFAEKFINYLKEYL